MRSPWSGSRGPDRGVPQWVQRGWVSVGDIELKVKDVVFSIPKRHNVASG